MKQTLFMKHHPRTVQLATYSSSSNSYSISTVHRGGKITLTGEGLLLRTVQCCILFVNPSWGDINKANQSIIHSSCVSRV
jgi:hypothetical protein